MSTWKLSIRPESEKGFDAFELCKKKFLLGLGWHHAYLSGRPSSLEEAKQLVTARWKEWPKPLKYLLEDMKIGDHVWIHQNGKYHLCKPTDEIVLYGEEIDPDYNSYDLGHARKATWVAVPDKFVTGTIQRGTIAPRMIRKIRISEKEEDYNSYIFSQLKRDPGWAPDIDSVELEKALVQITPQELFSLMSPDDVEDIVAAYLQDDGWMLIKSTCFRSKPKFEFSMLNKYGSIAHVQVKSGKSPDRLMPELYADYASRQNLIFLFSTHRDAYPGRAAPNVNTIEQDDLFKWAVGNLWAITLPLKVRLWIFLKEIPQ